MRKLAGLGQWLRFLTVPETGLRRRGHPGSVRAVRVLIAFAREEMVRALAVIERTPIVVRDDGDTRAVRVLDAIEYGFHRNTRSFYSNLREPAGQWRHVPATDPSVVIFDTYLCKRQWRRRVGYALKRQARRALIQLVEVHAGTLGQDHHAELLHLCHDLVDQAWQGLKMRRRLTGLFPTKRLRHQIRQALDIDPALVALARAARFRTRHHSIHQTWLTFVWQHQDELARIRRQTPGLLRVVAQHLFEVGASKGHDPTREAVKRLISLGVSKRSYTLLAHRSDRPFRQILRRCVAEQALDGVALALFLAESGHDAAFPRPLFYRVTMDEFGATMTAARIRERLSRVPRRVFAEARTRMAQADGGGALLQVSLEYRTIVDWFVVVQSDGHEHASWHRWLLLARDAEQRQRVAMAPITWPCAVEQLRTPEGEVLALATPLALFEEGRALRHCAFSYVAKCLDDQVRLFSARMWHQGRLERATIGLWRESWGWRIWDIRGPCNRRMGGHWIPLARQIAEAYSRNSGSAQLPLPVLCTLQGGAPGSAG